MRAPLDSTIGEEFENTRLPLGYFRGGKLPEPGRSQPCRCARQLRFAPTRDLFGSGRHPAEPPRGTSFWFWAGATRPAGSAGFECGFGLDSLVSSKIGCTRVPVVPAGSAGFECVFGLDSLVYSKIGHTRTGTDTNKTLSIFPPALAPTRPGLPCVYTHTSLDLTALDPYEDQNRIFDSKSHMVLRRNT